MVESVAAGAVVVALVEDCGSVVVEVEVLEVADEVAAGEDVGSDADDEFFCVEPELVSEALVPAAGEAIFAEAVFIDPPPQPARINAEVVRRTAGKMVRTRKNGRAGCNVGVISFMIFSRQNSRKENHTGASTLLVPKNRLNSMSSERWGGWNHE